MLHTSLAPSAAADADAVSLLFGAAAVRTPGKGGGRRARVRGRSRAGMAGRVGRLGWAGASGLGQRVPAAVSLVLWLAAGAAVAWGVLHGLGQRADVALPAPPSAPWAVDTPLVARALGARPATPVGTVAAPVADSRYSLLGVVAPTGADSHSGVALIAVDGQRPLPYRVGARVDGRWQVSAVQRRAVELVAVDAVAAGAPTTQLLTLPAR